MATLQSIKAPTPLLPTQGPSMPLSVRASQHAPCTLARTGCSTTIASVRRTSCLRMSWVYAYR